MPVGTTLHDQLEGNRIICNKLLAINIQILRIYKVYVLLKGIRESMRTFQSVGVPTFRVVQRFSSDTETIRSAHIISDIALGMSFKLVFSLFVFLLLIFCFAFYCDHQKVGDDRNESTTTTS